MALALANLLIHNDAVPSEARKALRAATLGPAESRRAQLESAARVLYLEAGLNCREAREIVGLEYADCAS
jgi:hypothetical protein